MATTSGGERGDTSASDRTRPRSAGRSAPAHGGRTYLATSATRPDRRPALFPYPHVSLTGEQRPHPLRYPAVPRILSSMDQAFIVPPGGGRQLNLGNFDVEVLAQSAQTAGAFALLQTQNEP